MSAIPVTAENVSETLEELKRTRDALNEANATVTATKEKLEQLELGMLGYLLRTDQQSVSVRGLYTAAVKKQEIYTATPDFVEWALQNDRTTVKVAAKQTGIRAYVEEFGCTPPGVTITTLHKLSLTKKG